MNLLKTSEFMMKYGVCPKCKNDKIGAEEGALFVGNNAFFRSCKCGWKIRVNEQGSVLPNLKENLDERICDIQGYPSNTQTLREVIEDVEKNNNIKPSDLDNMEEVELVRHMDFLTDLIIKKGD